MSPNNQEIDSQCVWIISANDLLLGDLVYLSANNQWTRRLYEAQTLTDKETADVLLRSAEGKSDIVIGPALVKAAITADGQIELKHFRDRFREYGPTHRRELNRTPTNSAQSTIQPDHV